MLNNTQVIRLINAGLLLAFLMGYMEWGGGNSSFIFQVWYAMFNKTGSIMETLTHPLIIFGLTGQILLIISAIRRVPGKWVNLFGLLLLSVIIIFVLLAGILSLNFKAIASVIPFTILSVLYFKYRRKKI